MATIILPAGTPVCDAAFPPPASSLVGHYAALGSYVSLPTSNPKNWTQKRIQDCSDHDIGIAMFAEQAESTVLTGYSSANLALGRQAEAMSNSFGYPKNCWVWFAVDTSPFGNFDAIAAAFQAYNDTSTRPVAAYCGSQCGEFLMDQGLIAGFHVPSAVSWSACSGPANGTTVFTYNGGKNFWYLSPHANMRQFVSIPFAGASIDPDVLINDTPFWFPNREDPPPVINPTEDNEMTADDWILLDQKLAALRGEINSDVFVDLLTNVIRSCAPGQDFNSPGGQGEFASMMRLYVAQTLQDPVNLNAIAAAVVAHMPPYPTQTPATVTPDQITQIGTSVRHAIESAPLAVKLTGSAS